MVFPRPDDQKAIRGKVLHNRVSLRRQVYNVAVNRKMNKLVKTNGVGTSSPSDLLNQYSKNRGFFLLRSAILPLKLHLLVTKERWEIVQVVHFPPERGLLRPEDPLFWRHISLCFKKFLCFEPQY